MKTSITPPTRSDFRSYPVAIRILYRISNVYFPIYFSNPSGVLILSLFFPFLSNFISCIIPFIYDRRSAFSPLQMFYIQFIFISVQSIKYHSKTIARTFFYFESSFLSPNHFFSAMSQGCEVLFFNCFKKSAYSFPWFGPLCRST